MSSNWEKFKKQDSPNGEPEGMMIAGSFTCQFCNDWVLEGKYFPADSVLSYKCSQGHLSIVENFRFM